MGRRMRHLNPAHMGASRAYDARTLTLSNGSAVTTWVDKTGNANATQANSLRRPTFQSTDLNGFPGLAFVETPNRSGLELANINIGTTYTSISAGRSTGASATQDGIVFWSNLTGNPPNHHIKMRKQSSNRTMNTYNDDTRTNNFDAATSRLASSAHIATFVQSGTLMSNCQYRDNGTSFTLVGVVQNEPIVAMTIGLIGSGIGYNFNGAGTIGAQCLFTTALSASQIKRLEHSYGYSFKIPCS